MEDVNKRRRIFLSLSKLECGPQEINPREYICLHLKFSERLKKTRIHFKSDVFAAVARSCGPVNGPGVPWGFRQTVLQVQSPQKTLVIVTFRHGSKRACVAGGICCVSKKELQPRERCTEVETENDEGGGEVRRYFSLCLLPSAPPPSFSCSSSSAFARQLRRLEMLIP